MCLIFSLILCRVEICYHSWRDAIAQCIILRGKDGPNPNLEEKVRTKNGQPPFLVASRTIHSFSRVAQHERCTGVHRHRGLYYHEYRRTFYVHRRRVGCDRKVIWYHLQMGVQLTYCNSPVSLLQLLCNYTHSVLGT